MRVFFTPIAVPEPVVYFHYNKVGINSLIIFFICKQMAFLLVTGMDFFHQITLKSYNNGATYMFDHSSSDNSILILDS